MHFWTLVPVRILRADHQVLVLKTHFITGRAISADYGTFALLSVLCSMWKAEVPQ